MHLTFRKISGILGLICIIHQVLAGSIRLNGTIPKIDATSTIKADSEELIECFKSSTLNSTLFCLKTYSLQKLQEIYQKQPIITLGYGVRLLRLPDSPTKLDSNQTANLPLGKITNNSNHSYRWEGMNLKEFLKSYRLEIDVKKLSDYLLNTLKSKDFPKGTKAAMALKTIDEGRHRRHRYNMLITMMFGVIAFSAVVIPLGFHLLSIVSGKALLLAKMALLLASINGLKRVANSGVHYGLYQVPGEHYVGHRHDHGEIHHPRQADVTLPYSL